MDFQQRLAKAVERGQRAANAESRAKQAQSLNEEQLKRLHSQYRLQLSEHIEQCLARLPQHFPGFQFETVVSDRGWGAAVSRDDIEASGGSRQNYFSRLELVIRPFIAAGVLELTARGTIRNKELYNRSQYQLLGDVELDAFIEFIDLWILEYAELYAAKGQ